jgi:hypothetical protein
MIMDKQIRFWGILMTAAMLLSIMAPALAAAPETFPKPDGIIMSDTLLNQYTVDSIAKVDDPEIEGLLDGQSAPDNKIYVAVLKDKDGRERTVKFGKEIKNKSQIREGDKVTYSVSEKLAFYIGKAGKVPGTGEMKLIFSAPKGEKPGSIEVKKSFYTVKIAKLDPDQKQVTARLKDKTTKVVSTPDLDFAKVKVGDNVIVMFATEDSIIVTAP